MKAGWSPGKILWRKKRINPVDDLEYIINQDVIAFTEKILSDYNDHEGIVYWAGKEEENVIHVQMAIAPAARTREGEFVVDHLSNARVVLQLHEHGQKHLGQVHSHPGTWVDHSGLDDRQAAFKRKGLLSVVVPRYGKDAMLPLHHCGVHRFQERTFRRLTNSYIKKHFECSQQQDSILIDMRYG